MATGTCKGQLMDGGGVVDVRWETNPAVLFTGMVAVKIDAKLLGVKELHGVTDLLSRDFPVTHEGKTYLYATDERDAELLAEKWIGSRLVISVYQDSVAESIDGN